jgi:PIN domain nuclease of toxin-antitoxin system
MRLLLDTHFLYWWFYEPHRISSKIHKMMADAEEIHFSSSSIWEIAIKSRLGKMKADPGELLHWIGQNDFQELPVFSRHALVVSTLPMHHSDPFDRLLIAQAMSEPLHLITADSKLKRYSDLVVVV